MKFVFNSYIVTKRFNQPAAWLNCIRLYTGILEALGKTNEVVSIEQIYYEGSYRNNGVKYQFMKVGKLGRYLPFKLHRFIKRQQPDVVFIQSLHFPLQVMQLRLLMGSGIRIIIQNHAEQPFTGFKKHLCRFADQFVDAYLFASKAMGQDWVDSGNLSSLKKIHEVMEVSSVFYPVAKQTAKAVTGINCTSAFLWVGRLNQNKDPLNVIRAFLKFAAIDPQVRLYMIYHTDELIDEIHELLAGEVKASSIQLVGQIPNDDLLYWYNSVDFIVSASHYEGSGTAICEAMSCGCIPIITNIPSFRMMTDNGRFGMLYEPGNETALLDALIKTQQMDMADQQRRSLNYFRSNLSFEAIAKKIHEVAASL